MADQSSTSSTGASTVEDEVRSVISKSDRSSACQSQVPQSESTEYDGSVSKSKYTQNNSTSKPTKVMSSESTNPSIKTNSTENKPTSIDGGSGSASKSKPKSFDRTSSATKSKKSNASVAKSKNRSSCANKSKMTQKSKKSKVPDTQVPPVKSKEKKKGDSKMASKSKDKAGGSKSNKDVNIDTSSYVTSATVDLPVSTEAASSYHVKPKIKSGSTQKDDENKNVSKQKSKHKNKSKVKSRESVAKERSKEKPKSRETVKGSKSKIKSKERQCKSKTKTPDNDNNKKKKSSSKIKQKSKQERDQSQQTESNPKLAKMVNKIETTRGATAVSNEATIRAAGFIIEPTKLFQSEYSVVHKAKYNKSGTERNIVVKMVNLTECSPRFRTNLLKNSVRILRYVSGCDNYGPDSSSGNKTGGSNVRTGISVAPQSPIFIQTYEIFVLSGVSLFIFMQECNAARSLYDLVKSTRENLAPADIRKWCKSIATGVNKLQRIGAAHRAIKLQHILFDSKSNPKLCGWSKAVIFYDAKKKKILKQRKERRVRRNYHLSPETFMESYDPSKADIWSIGVVLVAMCTKRYPFNVRDRKTKFSSQWREFIKKHEMNTLVRNLCHKIFIIDPKRRISSQDILMNKYFLAPTNKLLPRNCKADPDSIQEDNRVGGVSMICMADQFTSTTGAGNTTVMSANADTTSADKAYGNDDEEEVPNFAELEKNDLSGIDENATGDEGGNVGEEENLPPQELEVESHMAEKAAPEEAETEANPDEEGGEGVEQFEQQQETAADEGENEGDGESDESIGGAEDE